MVAIISITLVLVVEVSHSWQDQVVDEFARSK